MPPASESFRSMPRPDVTHGNDSGLGRRKFYGRNSLGSGNLVYKGNGSVKVDTKQLIEDEDDTSLRIFQMYQRKHYLPHNKRISNMAWRIQNRKAMRAMHRKSLTEVTADERMEMDEDQEMDDFDYVTHIRKISKDGYKSIPTTSTDTNTNISMNSTSNSLSSNSSLFSASNRPAATPTGAANMFPSGNEPNMLLSYINSLESTLDHDTKSNSGLKLSKKILQCSNCQTRTTPLWRKSKEGALLCNACGLFYKLHGVIRPMSIQTQPLGSNNQNSIQINKQILETNTYLFNEVHQSSEIKRDPSFSPTIISHHYYPANPSEHFKEPITRQSTFNHLQQFQHSPPNRTTNQANNSTSVGHAEAFAGVQGSVNATGNGVDEIDNLLNMNLFQPDSFAVGGNNIQTHEEHSKNLQGHFYDIHHSGEFGASDEIFPDKPTDTTENPSLNWLDFLPNNFE